MAQLSDNRPRERLAPAYGFGTEASGDAVARRVDAINKFGLLLAMTEIFACPTIQDK